MQPSPTILLVEDDPLVLRALTRLVKSRGMEVVAASSVRSALNAARECQGAIIDINLPDGSGLTLYEQLLARGDDLKVAFFSATVDKDEQHQATLLGEFIRKDRGPMAAVEYIEKRLGHIPESSAKAERAHSTVVPPKSTERRRRGAKTPQPVGARRKA